MKITRLAYVVFPVTDIARARSFYEDVLQLKPARIFEKNGIGEIDYDLNGGRITINCAGKAGDERPAIGATPVAQYAGYVAFEVENFSDALMRLRARKITLKSAPVETAEKQELEITDPDGNRIVICKSNRSKKDFVVI